MTNSKVHRDVFVYEAYQEGCLGSTKWRVVNHCTLPFDEDWSKYRIRTPLYAPAGITREVTETLHELNSVNGQNEIRWLGVIIRGPDGKVTDNESTVRVLVEQERPVIEEAKCRGCEEPCRHCGIAKSGKDHSSESPSAVTADKAPFREHAQRELAQREAGPIPVKWNEPSEAGSWVDWDIAAVDEV